MRRGLWSLVSSLACLVLFTSSPAESQGQGVTIYEGARLIIGDGTAPIENSAFVVQNNQFTQVGTPRRSAGARRCRARRSHRQDRDADAGRSARPLRLSESAQRHDVEGQLHPRQSDRPSAAPRLFRRRRRRRRRRSGRPLRHERRTHRLGRRAAETARRSRAEHAAVQDRRSRHGVSGRGRARPSLANGRVLLGLDARTKPAPPFATTRASGPSSSRSGSTTAKVRRRRSRRRSTARSWTKRTATTFRSRSTTSSSPTPRR